MHPVALRCGSGCTRGRQGRGGDYFGPNVNRAVRRIMWRTWGAGADVAVDRGAGPKPTPDGVMLLDLGEHPLPGTGAARPAVPSDRPGSARGLSSGAVGRSLAVECAVPADELPRPKNRGRKRCVARVRRTARDAARSCGMGKTRLALHAASLVVSMFPDGLWFCSLADVDEH